MLGRLLRAAANRSRNYVRGYSTEAPKKPQAKAAPPTAPPAAAAPPSAASVNAPLKPKYVPYAPVYDGLVKAAPAHTPLSSLSLKANKDELLTVAQIMLSTQELKADRLQTIASQTNLLFAELDNTPVDANKPFNDQANSLVEIAGKKGIDEPVVHNILRYQLATCLSATNPGVVDAVATVKYSLGPYFNSFFSFPKGMDSVKVSRVGDSVSFLMSIPSDTSFFLREEAIKAARTLEFTLDLTQPESNVNEQVRRACASSGAELAPILTAAFTKYVQEQVVPRYTMVMPTINLPSGTLAVKSKYSPELLKDWTIGGEAAEHIDELVKDVFAELDRRGEPFQQGKADFNALDKKFPENVLPLMVEERMQMIGEMAEMTPEQKDKQLDEILINVGMSSSVCRAAVIKLHRLKAIEHVGTLAKGFLSAYEEVANDIEYTVKTAHPLDPATRKTTFDSVQKIVGKKPIIIEFSHDPSVIQGVRVMAGRDIDNTLPVLHAEIKESWSGNSLGFVPPRIEIPLFADMQQQHADRYGYSLAAQEDSALEDDFANPEFSVIPASTAHAIDTHLDFAKEQLASAKKAGLM